MKEYRPNRPGRQMNIHAGSGPISQTTNGPIRALVLQGAVVLHSNESRLK